MNNPVNRFISEARELNVTYTNNGAIQLTTTDDIFVDQFSYISNYRALRDKEDIYLDQNELWSVNPLAALRFTVYLRLITRKVNLTNSVKGTTEKTQKGQGLRHESILRLMYIAENYPQSFTIDNLLIFVAAGSCKDLIQLLEYDLIFNGWENRAVNWDVVTQTIFHLLADPRFSDLMKKYLPQIKSSSTCKTERAKARNIIAKYLSSILFGKKDKYSNTYQQYRKMKSSGTAHQWQQLISKKQMNLIKFNQIHGRALNLLVNSKFLINNGLMDKYINWVESQDVVKYTGYVYELMSKLSKMANISPAVRYTTNKQFEQLVRQAKEEGKTKNLVAVVDTSASMGSLAKGANIPCIDIAKSLALYFSHLIEGPFSQYWIEFNSQAQLNEWIGNTPVDQYINNRSSYIGNTDFLSVARLFAYLKRNKDIPESEYPEGIVCISDCEFDPADLDVTNVRRFRSILKEAEFSEEYVNNFIIVLWNLEGSYYYESKEGYEFKADEANCYYFSGLDGSSLSFILGAEVKDKQTPLTTEEVLSELLNQELLTYLKVN